MWEYFGLYGAGGLGREDEWSTVPMDRLIPVVLAIAEGEISELFCASEKHQACLPHTEADSRREWEKGG